MDVWKKAQKFEKDWWGNCVNTYGEEEKQLTYADRMGLKFFHNGKSPYNIDLQGKSVLDIGGGACSLLLKSVNGKTDCLCVFDPCNYPEWVADRYSEAGISYEVVTGEDYKESYIFDEVWTYNVLQHVKDPAKIITNARKSGRLIRIFEWIGIKDEHGHPHELTKESLDKWLGGEGKTELFNRSTLRGMAYFGIFKGDHYEK